jgi:hypothetical protein
MTGLIQA